MSDIEGFEITKYYSNLAIKIANRLGHDPKIFENMTNAQLRKYCLGNRNKLQCKPIIKSDPKLSEKKM